MHRPVGQRCSCNSTLPALDHGAGRSSVRSPRREGGSIAEQESSPHAGEIAEPWPAAGASGIARAEIQKLAENTRYRAECQITACGFWGNFQLLVGGAAAISAGIAGASAFSKQSIVAGSFATVASVLSAVIAAVKAGERAGVHERAANELNLLSERASRLHALSADDRGAADGLSPADLGTAFAQIVSERDDLARKAPFVNRRLCRLAARFLERGQSYFGAAAQTRREKAPKPRLVRRIWRTR